jgi:hypothetical protein
VPNRGFTVEWPGLGVKLEAGPLPFNRKLFDCFWRSLPFRTIQLHAMVSGEDMYSYCPVSPVEHIGLVERQVPIHELPPGSITWSTLGLVAIVYGPCTESLRTQPIAAIPKRFHEDLKRAGRAAWDSIFTTKEKLIVEFGKKKESRG